LAIQQSARGEVGVAQQSGQVLSEISNAMVALHREHFGRGPSAAKTLSDETLVTCVLTDVYTTVEKTLIAAGQADHVREARRLHQLALEDTYTAAVAEIVGRPVDAFLSATHIDPDVAVAIFLLRRVRD
jgi:uncharacterized protein YbcI